MAQHAHTFCTCSYAGCTRKLRPFDCGMRPSPPIVNEFKMCLCLTSVAVTATTLLAREELPPAGLDPLTARLVVRRRLLLAATAAAALSGLRSSLAADTGVAGATGASATTAGAAGAGRGGRGGGGRGAGKALICPVHKHTSCKCFSIKRHVACINPQALADQTSVV